MGNIEENVSNGKGANLIGKTIKDNNNNSTALVIPKAFAKELDIENSKVSMSVLEDCDGDKHLFVTTYHREIGID